ncbi:tubulin-specific chaperone c [Pyrenophora seminiperda CCB06]|uniref:Tubulin-specific chaperone c n=1 Tax=Pyrenophora seminiperda CCB06 TaxID=1302712 RepID=A0A3M7M7U7_9PLEO|nr:tubulin-specific chaperone c [Pyrenophora seminiperda CCB06]
MIVIHTKMTCTNLKEDFYRQFQKDVAALSSQISSLPSTPPASATRTEAIDACLAGIDRLSHDVKDASSYLPAYDQRTYSESIKALSEQLQNIRNTFSPPKKFSFKNRKKDAAVVVTPADTPPTQKTTTSDQSTTTTTTTTTTIPRPEPETPPSSTISHKSSAHITLPSSAAAHTTTSPTLSHLTRCVVNLSPCTNNGTTPFATLYLREISHSLIICGHVAGAIHITDVSDSVIVTACRQFRMHGSKNVHVYLHSASRPIFEDCHGLRFAPLPAIYMTPHLAQSENQWNQIDDFKWLKAEPSPHFSILPKSERIADQVWDNKLSSSDDVSPDTILNDFGVQ